MPLFVAYHGVDAAEQQARVNALAPQTERCITHSSLSVGEVAYLLGYSEPAAFHRAFKRWTGVTPQAFRQRQRAESPGWPVPPVIAR